MTTIPSDIYYVYYYLRNQDSPTGREGTPYYVGKGKGRRIDQKHGRITVPQDKAYRIKIAEGLSESAAHQIEMMHILLWGRVNLGTGILRNWTNGGDGTSGRIVSSATREKVRNSNRGKPKSTETIKKLSLSQIGRKKHPDSVAKSIATQKRNREQSANWVPYSCKYCQTTFLQNSANKTKKKYCSIECVSLSKIEKRSNQKTYVPGVHSLSKIHKCSKCGKIGRGPGMGNHMKSCQG